MRRQEILQRDRPPRLWVIVDEAVLARVTGGRDVMREQLRHLAAAAERPNVTVQVIGFDYGAHPGGQSHIITVDTVTDHPTRSTSRVCGNLPRSPPKPRHSATAPNGNRVGTVEERGFDE